MIWKCKKAVFLKKRKISGNLQNAYFSAPGLSHFGMDRKLDGTICKTTKDE